MMLELLLSPLVVRVGLWCLGAQCVLYAIFVHALPYGPWSSLPGLTAHQVVCLPLMIYFTYLGITGWFGVHPDINSTFDRVLASHDFAPSLEPSHRLTSFVLGELLFWDIPAGFLVPSLRDPIMWAHHFGMALLSAVVLGVFSSGQPVGSFYALFFFGVIELSSVFLTVVDVFHPKHKAWFDFVEKGQGTVTAALRSLNELMRILFALSFLSMRSLYFPYVIFFGVLPDFVRVADLPQEERKGVPKSVLYFVCSSAVLFSLLQMYWGTLVGRQVFKALGGSSKKKK